MIITIDGASGTGKTTVARELAKKLGFAFFDTGALYRSFAWFLLQKEVDVHDEKAVCGNLADFNLSIEMDEIQNKRYYCDSQEITCAIRTPSVTDASSIISAMAPVRTHLLQFQREFAKQHSTVFEGRDLGSVVFPNADYKVFLFASPEIKAKRRLQELREKSPHLSVTYEEILHSMLIRDERDTTRAIAPLKVPSNALSIDTSQKTAIEIVDIIANHIEVK